MEIKDLNLLIPDKPIAFNRDLVNLGIKVNGALFLSQCIYWSKRTIDKNGWFYKVISEWEEETGLTEQEQKTVKKKLLELKIIDIEKRGIPAKNYFKLNAQVLLNHLIQSGGINRTGEVKTPLHSITENTQENTTKTFSDENDFSSSEEDISIEDCDEEGNIILKGNIKTKRENKNKIALKIHNVFLDMAKRELKTRPIKNKAGYFRVLNAMNNGLEVKHFKILFKDWFLQGRPDEELIQITRALSDIQINKFKAEHKI